jgi:hypothetical protein
MAPNAQVEGCDWPNVWLHDGSINLLFGEIVEFEEVPPRPYPYLLSP